jgi:hypothetical protein
MKMPVLLVTYELKNPNQDYSTFLGMLDSYPQIKLSDSMMLVETVDSPRDFFDGIWPFIDPNDRVMIFEVNSECFINGNEAARQWMKGHCKKCDPVMN